MKRAVGCILALAVSVSDASAAEIHRDKLASWNDPTTPPNTRYTCNSWARGNLPFGGGWSTCTGYKFESQFMESEAYLVTNGPDDVGEDAKNAAVQCAIMAGIAAVGAGYATGGTAALGAAKLAFASCMSAKASSIADKYSLEIQTASGWGGWH